MSLWKRIIDAVKPKSKPETPLTDQPKDYPEGPPQNHTEHIDHIGIQPGSKV